MQKFLERLIALLLLIMFIPLLALFYLLVKLDSRGSFIFTQERLGKNKKPFRLYKIRTMVNQAEKLKSNYQHLNESDGPVFKIRNDPRYTKAGKWLSRTGLDELPQLINIIKGEMSFVGPRPLPTNEALKVPREYQDRFTVPAGITSLWVIKGTHRLSFDQWMKLDVEYVRNKSIWLDITIAFQTILIMAKSFIR